ncbi:hypothetical protein CI109_103334 [Kwoniella shandongensis]|uniref:Uncharacterized protein n=1 Tax=Kwoniella shandongensis TaxID=1734106 RepID=A0A5M6BWC8_9TREE|nr:uncharacterized protein CI109_004415 [Kwoniella shandongensis]KAA5527124.1 hypothetical protein CI109_004415 [Kwoniella shandongensis]
MSFPGPYLVEIRAQGQVALPTGFVSPLILAPSSSARTPAEWNDVIESWDREEVRRALWSHGGILLRGLPIETAQHFSELLHAFKWTPHVEVGNPVKRTVHAPNVANANEGPPELYIPAHNEFGISSIFPSNICFWARIAPEKGQGGETPISSSQWVLQRLKEEAPEFVQTLADKGVTYTIYHPPTQLSGDANGNGVLAAWGSKVVPGDDAATTKAKVEEEIQRISPETTWRWESDGGLFTFQRQPAFRIHPLSGEPILFGNITSYFGGAKNRGTLEPPYLDATGFYKPPPLYGDDSAIPLEYLELLMTIVEQVRAVVPWEQNDVFVIDNLAFQHSRLPWKKGSRSILASLWDSGLEKDMVATTRV